jgi:hypothetical protein
MRHALQVADGQATSAGMKKCFEEHINQLTEGEDLADAWFVLE